MFRIFVLLLFMSQILINQAQNGFDTHIVGGQRASEGQFPHVVSLRWAFGHFCGGAILNARFILSASHCWWFLDITHVVAGAIQLNDTNGVRYDVIEKIDFPGYNFTADPLKDDIGLLRVNRDIQFTWNVQPIPINRNRIIFNIPGSIAGWGHTTGGPTWDENFAPTPSNDLRFISVNVISHRECERRFSIASNLLLNRDHICTFATRGVGVCTFDSGSPVIANGEVVGVVAFVVGCALEFPDWGPRVSSYSRWIDSHIN